jgi:hypothetical protein
MGEAEALTSLQPSKQTASFDSGRRRQRRCLHLSAKPHQRPISGSHSLKLCRIRHYVKRRGCEEAYRYDLPTCGVQVTAQGSITPFASAAIGAKNRFSIDTRAVRRAGDFDRSTERWRRLTAACDRYPAMTHHIGLPAGPRRHPKFPEICTLADAPHSSRGRPASVGLHPGPGQDAGKPDAACRQPVSRRLTKSPQQPAAGTELLNGTLRPCQLRTANGLGITRWAARGRSIRPSEPSKPERSRSTGRSNRYLSGGASPTHSTSLRAGSQLQKTYDAR